MSYFLQRFRLKWIMLGGQLLVLAGTILLVFGGSKEHYWPFTFPGFCLGTAGTTIVYGTTKYVSAPPSCARPQPEVLYPLQHRTIRSDPAPHCSDSGVHPNRIGPVR